MNFPENAIINIHSFLDFKDSIKFCTTNKRIYRILTDKNISNIWKTQALECFNTYNTKKNKIPYVFVNIKSVNYFSFIKLCINSGCNNCNRLRIKKIYWEYNSRWCVECFNLLTISSYILLPFLDLYIPKEYCNKIENLPSIIVKKYNYGRFKSGKLEYTLYKKEDILNILKTIDKTELKKEFDISKFLDKFSVS